MEHADAYLTVTDCLKAKDVVKWAVKINGGTFDGVGTIAAVKVPTSRVVMQATVFPQTRFPRVSGSPAFVILCLVREIS